MITCVCDDMITCVCDSMITCVCDDMITCVCDGMITCVCDGMITCVCDGTITCVCNGMITCVCVMARSPVCVMAWSPVCVMAWSPLCVMAWSPVCVMAWSPVCVMAWSRVCVMTWSPVCVMVWSPVWVMAWPPAVVPCLFERCKNTQKVRTLLDPTKQDRVWIFEEVLIFKATDNTKTNHLSFSRQLESCRRKWAADSVHSARIQPVTERYGICLFLYCPFLSWKICFLYCFVWLKSVLFNLLCVSRSFFRMPAVNSFRFYLKSKGGHETMHNCLSVCSAHKREA